ncbi:uncharacterized protein BT62DRAFT_453427 [Guyanagaster necrorhizus]|uniref:Uncharacterized protein n=1 Tax=Guyanagaster necrorhizus TaxID=856835 RepID=A0A9P7VJ37_9AGAR|nr:uncharacterized protein BT62DRAFT_453427 [Guyanagaster necrorhizus MCA 3950]KAG7442048.1 hypothetical protein BT62DRAFT_453427 [Guyanagaster necrorhizus MCA 3950]
MISDDPWSYCYIAGREEIQFLEFSSLVITWYISFFFAIAFHNWRNCCVLDFGLMHDNVSVRLGLCS